MLHIEDLRKGDTFYECEYGENDEYIAICNPCRRDNGWAIYGEDVKTGARVRFYCNDDYRGYLKLYSYPAYVSWESST